MVEEYDSIMRNDVWEVMPRPEGNSVATSKWIYKVKVDVDGSIEKHKARFVARGFSQVESIDYDETFAPVARYTSIRTIMAIATEMGWSIHQMDVKTAFLKGILEEEVYIEQPQGLRCLGETLMCVACGRRCMDSSKLLELGIPRSTHTCRTWALKRVRQIQTSTTWWTGRILSF